MSEASQPRTLANLTDQQFIDGYVIPHIEKNRDDGYHTRAIVLEEALRRLQEYVMLKNILRQTPEE